MPLRHQADYLPTFTDDDFSIEGKSSRQFGAELHPRNRIPDHECAGRAYVHGTEVLQFIGERLWPEGSVTADIDAA
jgi:hypothetical protein